MVQILIAANIIVALVAMLLYTNKLARKAGVERPIEICSNSCSCHIRNEGCSIVIKDKTEE
jgi:hypothetical protein